MWKKNRKIEKSKNQFLHFLVFTFFSFLVIGYCLPAEASGDYVPGEILVKFKPSVIGMSIKAFSAAPEAADIRPSSIRVLSQKFGITKYERIFHRALQRKPKEIQLADYYKLVFPKERDVLEVVREFNLDPNVIYAQPNYIYRAYKTIPNDEHYGSQWGLTKIRADDAWDRTTGSSKTVIAVIDTGVDYNHEDLQGKVDTVNDYDYVNNDNDAMDDEGHGTGVAGVIAAMTDNSVGIAGVDWQAKILPLKVMYPVLGQPAAGTTDDIIAGIEAAQNYGAHIVNMSFGSASADFDIAMKEVVNEAFNKGCVLVAAAGNDGVEDKNYPAANKHVLAVAATDQNDLRSVWSPTRSSNYGTWIDVSAPGSNIYTTKRGGGYDSESGTSLAAPFVAGLAGLIKAVNPGLTNQQIMDKIKANTDNIDSLNPNYAGKLGTGRINAYLAVAGAVANITSPESGAYVKGKIDILGTASGWDFSRYVLEALQSGVFVATIETSTSSVESGKLGNWETTGVNGEHTIRLRVFTNKTGTEEDEVLVYVDNITPEVEITYPIDGATIEGKVTIRGTAKDRYFERYVLEYGEGTSPSSFEKIKESYVSVDTGVLGTWETAGLEGLYTIRLTAYDKADTSATKSITVNIQLAPPTKEAEPQPSLPLTYALPNPFIRTVTSEVTFNYSLQGNFNTKIYLFDLSGNLIWQKSYLAGENGGKSGANNPPWDGKDHFGANVPNGVYLYQIVTDNRVIAKGKIIVLN